MAEIVLSSVFGFADEFSLVSSGFVKQMGAVVLSSGCGLAQDLCWCVLALSSRCEKWFSSSGCGFAQGFFVSEFWLRQADG